MFGSLDISTSALVAQRTRMDVIAGNLANAQTLHRADGKPGPYKRHFVLFNTGDGKGGPGVHVQDIREDTGPGDFVYDPKHPSAIKAGPNQGYVEYPNVVQSVEMINGMLASRAYEANIAAIDVTKGMISASLRLLA